MSDRPAIPRPLERAVRVEAGHRCAIPTCRATSGLQIHHIDDWSKVKEHSFENLVLLCAICHSRATSGEIDRRSVIAYKANLSLLVNRYSDLERRVLEQFVQDPSATEVVVDVGHAILLNYLVADGLLRFGGAADGAIWFGVGTPPEDEIAVGQLGPARWVLTDEGRHFVGHLRRAETVT